MTYLPEVEHQVQFADIAKESVENLNKEVYSLEVSELVIVCVNAGTEEEAGVSPVYDAVVAEFHEVGLMFLISRSY